MAVRDTMSSREYYGLHNTRDFSKGKSFRYNLEWTPTGHYFNDDYIQDFISYQGKLYICIKSNTGVIPTNTTCWAFIMEGQKGEKGDTGTLFIPSVDASGNLSWSNSGGLMNPVTKNITGPLGPRGLTGDNISLRNSGTWIQWKPTLESGWNNLMEVAALRGPKGDQGDRGLPLEFQWDGTKLGVRAVGQINYTYVDLRGAQGGKGDKGVKGNKGDTGGKGDKGDTGDQGPSILLQVGTSSITGKQTLQKRYTIDAAWDDIIAIDDLRGPRGYSILIERDIATGNIMYRYENETPAQNKIMIYKDDVMGPQGNSIAKTYVGDDGYLYLVMSDSKTVHRVGYVRGDKGDDGREIMLRVSNDPTQDADPAGSGTHLQWKYAGDEYNTWTNLIQINEMFNVLMAGLQMSYEVVTHDDDEGVETTYDKITLSNYKTSFDEDGNIVIGDKIADISSIELPIANALTDVSYDGVKHVIVFHYQTSTGETTFEVPMADVFTAGNGIAVSDTGVISVVIDPSSETNFDGTPVLESTHTGVKINGVMDKLIRSFDLVKTTGAGDETNTWQYVITSQNGTQYKANLPAFELLADAKYDSTTHMLHLYFLDNKTGDEHDVEIDLHELVEIYGVKPDGGLELTAGDATSIDGLFGIKEKGVVESMLSDALQKLLHDQTRPISHAALLDLQATAAMEPGMLYIITDYQTIYSENGLILGSSSSLYPSAQWNIAIRAINNSVLDENASILEHPDWSIKYEIYHTIPEDRGRITYMKDNNGNSAYYDFQNRLWYMNRSYGNINFFKDLNINSSVAGAYIHTFGEVDNSGTSINASNDFRNCELGPLCVNVVIASTSNAAIRENISIKQGENAVINGRSSNVNIEFLENVSIGVMTNVNISSMTNSNIGTITASNLIQVDYSVFNSITNSCINYTDTVYFNDIRFCQINVIINSNFLQYPRINNCKFDIIQNNYFDSGAYPVLTDILTPDNSVTNIILSEYFDPDMGSNVGIITYFDIDRQAQQFLKLI